MNHEQLLEKLGSARLNMSPAMRDTMQRVREVGLHKVAASMHAVPEFTLKIAAQVLGTQLIHQHLRFSKIAAGIRALQALDQSGEITLEKTAMPPIPAAALKETGALSKAMLEAGSGGKLFNPSMMQGGGAAAGRGASEAGQALQEALALSGKKIPPPIPGAAAMGGAAKPPPIPAAAMGGAKPPPIPAAARGPASMETKSLLHDIHGQGTSPDTMRAMQEIQQMMPQGRTVMASLNPIDFAKMANIFRLGAKGGKEVTSLIPSAGRAAEELATASRGAAGGEKELLQTLPGFFEGSGATLAKPSGAKGMFEGFNPPVPGELPPMGRLPTG